MAYPEQNINGFKDHYGTQQYIAPNGELVSVPLYKLIGDVFTGTTLDTNFWTISTGTGGAASIIAGELILDTGTTANNATEITSVRTARFSGLAPNKIRIVVQLPDTGVANNSRHWGMGVFNGSIITSGAVFQMNGTNFELVTYKAGVAAPITNGTFNGQYGTTFNPGLASHFYEIIYQPRQVIWLADNKIIHTLSAASTTWTDEYHLPIHMGCENSGGLAQSVTMKSRIATVARFGISDMLPTSAFISGLNAGQILKNTPGNIHSITFGAITNNAVVTFYDTATLPIPVGARVIWSTGGMASNTVPFDIAGDKSPFHIGLTIAITVASANAWVKYE